MLVIAACYICNIEAADTCDRWSGPAGNTHCVKFDIYSDYQWATCRTNLYIQTKSKGRHICTTHNVKYCYYQCMIDVHDQDDGAVYSDCKCSAGDPVPAEGVPLPAWCYSPDGKTCSWYRKCLNKTYPQCENDDNDYGIKFAEKVCNLYNESYNKFSPQGQRWIDGVRKCLQLKLVPLVDTTHDKTCAELKSTAFKSHSPCYLNPDQSALSYCDLSLNDQHKVFWTIKSAFPHSFKASVKGLLEVMSGCRGLTTQSYNVDIAKAIIEKAADGKIDQAAQAETRIKTWLENTVSTFPTQLNLFVESDNLHMFFNRQKPLLTNDKETERSKYAGKILDAVALEENWQDKGVAWFGYANNETEWEENTMSIRLVVADRYKYDTSLSETKAANLTTALVDLSEAVLKGTLTLMVNGESITIAKLTGCLDWNCKEHAFYITALEENNGAVIGGAVINEPMYTLLLASFVFFVINILFL